MPLKGQHLSESAKAKLRAARSKQIHPSFAKRGLTQPMLDRAAALGLKNCSKCKQFLSPAEFHGEGNQTICAGCCRKYAAECRAAMTPEEKEQKRVRDRQYRQENPLLFKKAELMKNYGVTLDWYEEKLAHQDGHCALCDAVTDGRYINRETQREYLIVDHDHENGQVRGLLCAKCNTALHRVEYTEDWALKAILYLEKYGSHENFKLPK